VTGRHRNAGPSLGILAGIVAVVLLAALAGWGGYRLLNRHSCTNPVTVTVAAAPEISTALQTVAERWNKAKGGPCTSIVVDPEEPGDVAATVAGQRGATLTGLGQPDGRLAVPDAWVPDSTTWLDRVRTVSPDLVPQNTTSIAQSPIVLGMPQPVAASLGWPKTPITWATLLQQMTTGSGLKTGIVEPGRDASGLAGLLALRSVAAAYGPRAQEATVAALRALAAGRSALRDDLVAHFPKATDRATLASSLAAAPLPEQTVLAYNANKPSVPLAAVYLDPAPTPLDYPYVVLPGAQPEAATAARDLLSMLSPLGFRDMLARAWLRSPDNSAGFTPGPGAPSGPPTPAPAADPGLVQQTLSTWTALTQPGRLLAVIDVSGSMLEPVPAAPGFNREQVTVRAAQSGLQLFDDTWAVGLWIFSTDLDGHTAYKELVPIGPLSSQRAQLNAGLAGIQPKRTGNTGLYETIIAAYKTVQQGWDPGRVNSVLIMTDGQQDNPPNGMTLDQLVGELQKVVNPRQPVEVIALGIGTEVSKPALTRITQTTGGGVFIATDPTQIGAIFLQAIALRPGSGG
jgi:Ca-activated chloride channel homolog